ncbi:Imm51 family immunity protein [Paenibacillus campi]|uniref:Imm51 family immunity protein n=1 Tax=Paenibacillus campi TaxID=3106031 RepID=UPI002AFF4380|nr:MULTISPECIES: Imm51 family immunity protein [unclassified Paenibacillus]
MSKQEIDETIAPFKWVAYDGGEGASVILVAGMYKQQLFDSRADEGFEGSGYDWAALAAVYLAEKMPELETIVRFDPEADMFCAYSSDTEALHKFMIGFHAACEQPDVIANLFAQAELD